MSMKLKVDDTELDVEELDVEWSDREFARYDGGIPKSGTVLNGQVTKMWWTYSGDGTAMLKLLWVADETAGEFEGMPAWENMVLKKSAAFKYGPFLQFFGLTLSDVKNKTYVADDDDSNGAPIEKIAKWSPGSDNAFCAISVSRERYGDNWQAHVGEWLEYDPDRADEDDEEEAPARPTAAGRGAKSGTATRKAPAGRRKAAEAEVEEVEEAEEAEEAEEEAPARGRRAPAKAPARKAPAKPASKAPARGRRGSSEEPPF